MVINPFFISGKIDPRFFCDRERESQELIRLIDNGNNVVLISPRRMGKTGLIHFCYSRPEIEENYFTFFIDILQTSSLREFIFLLGREIFRKLASKGKRMVTGFVQTLKSLTGKFGYDVSSGLPTFDVRLGDIVEPELTLEEIFRYLANAKRPCVVAIDEFQQIARYPEKNVEAMLRAHLQQSTNCSFIFSGSQRHILREMFLESARPFYNSATIINLEAIPEVKYVEFIEDMFRLMGKEIEAGLAREIYGMFEGHTFYVQRVCNEAFSFTPEGGRCDGRKLHDAIENILGSLDTLYREILQGLTLKQKELLYAIAMEKKARGVTSEGFIRKYALASASSVQSTLRKLMDHDIVMRKEDTYQVADRFFDLWLREAILS